MPSNKTQRQDAAGGKRNMWTRKQIKEKADKTDTVSFAVGLCIEEDSQKIYDAMKTADVNMYEDKKKFYEQFPERKRR